MTTLGTMYISRKVRIACGYRGDINTIWLSLLPNSAQVTHQSSGNHRKSEFKAYTPSTQGSALGDLLRWYSSQSIHS